MAVTLRLGLNADYDRVQELANQHRLVRQMLGPNHTMGDWADTHRYSLQTLKDNLRLFTPLIQVGRSSSASIPSW